MFAGGVRGGVVVGGGGVYFTSSGWRRGHEKGKSDDAAGRKNPGRMAHAMLVTVVM